MYHMNYLKHICNFLPVMLNMKNRLLRELTHCLYTIDRMARKREKYLMLTVQYYIQESLL